ncbi:MAG: peroxiredoxin family protein, partial [Planctomycetota bacterium]
MHRCLLAALLFTATLHTQRPASIVGQEAPRWEVSEWFQLPTGKKSLGTSDFKDKVVYLYCFQSWCPGCHSHGFPTLQKLVRKFQKRDDVAFVAVQTVFEGFQTNTL